ncbi:MAG: GNAT family N-acetyltransferase [Endomicrobia bacterium]|nr:GNAT family N-acetyltransferase [Endomicrobiia bacterium]
MEIIPVSDEKLIEITAKLADEIWREHYSPMLPAGQVDYMLKNLQSAAAIEKQISEQNYMYFLVKSERSSFEGYFAVVPEEKDMFLSKLYVRKESRGGGYARQAVNFVRELAKSMHLKRVTLTVSRENTGSIEAYKKMNFQILCEVNKDIGGGFFMNDYKMGLEV